MKRLYYFSKSSLQFVEIRNFKIKLFGYLSFSVILLGLIIVGGYTFINSISGTGNSLGSLKAENDLLEDKIHEMIALYDDLNKEIDSLSKVNNELRIAANLPPVSDEERLIGVGGGYFDNSVDFMTEMTDKELSKALGFIDEISRKLAFEKAQYDEITDKIKDNQKLYKALPAIKPSSGIVADHGFGMRLHPILGVKRMHDGIDIITDVGTPVHAAGNGKVDFVGVKGGYGLTVELDHGFGYRTVYAHLSKFSVKVGQKISRGDVIAKSGNSGLSSGPHVHYEVLHDGVKQNPSEFFFDDFGVFEFNKKN